MPAQIVVPEVGESIVEARVARWFRNAGDAVALGEPLVELETDKVNLEVPAPAAGVLSRIDHAAGADVKIGEVLGVIEESQAAVAAPAGSEAAKAPVSVAAPPEADKPRATPTARKAAAQNAVDLARVTGSGVAGRVMRKDVEQVAQGAQGAQEAAPRPAAQAAPPPAPRANGGRTEERIRMSKRRATIARRLVEAQSTAAMLSTFNEVDMTAVMALRRKFGEEFQKAHNGTKLGFMSFFVRASVEALKRFPSVNASIDGNDIVYHGYFDIGIAVGSPRGLEIGRAHV